MILTKDKYPWLYELLPDGSPLYPHVYIKDKESIFEAHYD